MGGEVEAEARATSLVECSCAAGTRPLDAAVLAAREALATKPGFSTRCCIGAHCLRALARSWAIQLSLPRFIVGRYIFHRCRARPCSSVWDHRRTIYSVPLPSSAVHLLGTMRGLVFCRSTLSHVTGDVSASKK